MRWAMSGAEVENGGGKPVHPLPGGVRKPGWVTDILTFVGYKRKPPRSGHVVVRGVLGAV